MDLCTAITAAREDCGLSQRALAERLDVPRLKITRLEAGVGSVELLLQVMPLVSLRLSKVAKGQTIVQQLKTARRKRGWSVPQCALKTDLDPRTIEAVEAGGGSIASLIKMLEVVAPNAMRQPVTRAYWDYDRSKSSEADSRFTPIEFLNEIVGAFGEIALDPCSHAAAPIQAKRKIILPEDGLEACWQTDGLVWINPPFSHLAPWLERANEAWRNKEVSKMIFLLPASRLDLRAYFDLAACNAITLVLRERLRFVREDSTSPSYRAPFALTLVVWGYSDDEIGNFMTRVPSIKIPMRNVDTTRRSG
ncbi:hypothetical protein EH31_06560 [Erythrobacter longus]|uniref:HTH cro/C1-type domain-containing protein n=1 Tax=Erythrobacter longus TaxID=1044 RepID=A0A074MM76_ERYLO|nr:DNA N-6-adenine-methyltransferase [Erythrobacter longus]KEO86742.1 hypothetical protein EH31_06560 [Erythrobacter longus]